MDLVRVIEILHKEHDDLHTKAEDGCNPKKYCHQMEAIDNFKDKLMAEIKEHNKLILKQVEKWKQLI